MLYLTRDRGLDGVRLPRANGLDRLFAELTHGFDFGPVSGADATEFVPSMDVHETDREWRVRTELPGVAAEDVQISVEGNTLTVVGEKKRGEPVEGEDARRSERRYGKFTRSLEFPTELDATKVEARAKNGVLTITLPKAEKSLPKTIAVKAE